MQFMVSEYNFRIHVAANDWFVSLSVVIAIIKVKWKNMEDKLLKDNKK